MSIEVKCIDTNKAKAQLKKCPKEVQDYVRSLEGVYKANQANLNLAISKIKQLSKANEAKTSNESERVCPDCGFKLAN